MMLFPLLIVLRIDKKSGLFWLARPSSFPHANNPIIFTKFLDVYVAGKHRHLHIIKKLIECRLRLTNRAKPRRFDCPIFFLGPACIVPTVGKLNLNPVSHTKIKAQSKTGSKRGTDKPPAAKVSKIKQHLCY